WGGGGGGRREGGGGGVAASLSLGNRPLTRLASLRKSSARKSTSPRKRGEVEQVVRPRSFGSWPGCRQATPLARSPIRAGSNGPSRRAECAAPGPCHAGCWWWSCQGAGY